MARGQNASDRARFQFREAVRFRKGIGGEINSKAGRVRLPNGADVRGASVFVGISKPTFPAIGADQLAQFPAVNCFPYSGQVSRLVMAPKLPGRQSGYLRAELSPRHTAFAVCDFPPVKSKRTAPGITSAAPIERAGRRARFGGSSGNGNRARFGIPRYEGKVNLSLHVLVLFTGFGTGFGFVLSRQAKGKGEPDSGPDSGANKGFPDPAESVGFHRFKRRERASLAAHSFLPA